MVATTQAVATVDLLRWMPLIPLLASLINMFFGARLGRKTAGGLACAAVLSSFAIALYIFWLLPATGMFRDTVYTWIESGSFQVKLSFQVDALSRGDAARRHLASASDPYLFSRLYGTR
jgi:hypothetical protein